MVRLDGGLVDTRVVHDGHLAVQNDVALFRAAVSQREGQLGVLPHLGAVAIHGHLDEDVLHLGGGVRVRLGAVTTRRLHGDALRLRS